MARERWTGKLGVILAVSASAIGLGNFLRFPGVAAANGGGAFMIPYFVALLLLGLPLMWVEWTIGRFGGGFGHSSAPGAFHSLYSKSRFIKYFGVIGIFGPIVILIYYTYVESWLLGYSVFALTGKYAECDAGNIAEFLKQYTGCASGKYFSSMLPAYLFFLGTFAANIAVVALGIRGGIERVCRWALPLLVILALVLMVRVFTLPSAQAGWSVGKGMGFLWNPDWSKLTQPGVWLAAAGQIFFTLSVGIGAILTYASYLRKEDDVALAGLTSASANEFAEVILGASIVIPAAFAFFGPLATAQYAQGGTFDLGFYAMPLVLKQLYFGHIFGFLWFALLFLAGITSTISLAQPAVAFLEDEFNLSRREAVTIFAVVTFILCHVSIFGLSGGERTALNELDFWAVNVCLVVFALIEAILFAWFFGMQRAWTELHAGSDITIPVIFRYIIKFVTPVLLMAILGWWLWQEGGKKILFLDKPPDPAQVLTRILLVLLFAILCFLVWAVWKRKAQESKEATP